MIKEQWDELNINSVVISGLCTRCGACYGACPHNVIVWDNQNFPHATEECTRCQICLAVCGGTEVDFSKYAEKHYGSPQDLTKNAIEPVRYSAVAHSTDVMVRKSGASGGIVSQIAISLLERDEIDGVVVVGFSKDSPLRPEAKIARSKADVLNCAQSKYFLFPVAHIYAEILRTPGRYAVIGLPCQIHSLFRWGEISKKIHKRVVLIVGLVCHANLEPAVVNDLLQVKRVRQEDISQFEFRGGEWPGGIRVTKKNGQILPLHELDIKDGAFNYLSKLYIGRRCLLCIDYSADLSDIAIADPWLRNNRGEYLYKGGWSLVLVKTERGHNVFKKMEECAEIISEKVDTNLVIRNSRPLTQHKKRGAFIRIKKLLKQRKATPRYFLEFPSLCTSDYIREYVYQMTLVGWHIRKIRKILLKIAFSKFGSFFGRMKASFKKIKYRLSA